MEMGSMFPGCPHTAPRMANRNYRYTPSILRIIRSAHWTALAINDSVLGLGRDSCRSSGFFRWRATRIPATMAKTRFRPSSMWIILADSLFVRYNDGILSA